MGGEGLNRLLYDLQHEYLQISLRSPPLIALKAVEFYSLTLELLAENPAKKKQHNTDFNNQDEFSH